ncbi:hypothetical protein NQ315_003785, partial [Exocentrus adspersus]
MDVIATVVPRASDTIGDTPMYNDPSQTLNARYESTLAQVGRLRNMGYVLFEMWECRFQKQPQEKPHLKQSTESHCNTYRYCKCNDEEQIKYVDVCSLFPWVCKYGKFSLGHPEVVVGEDCSNLNIENVECSYENEWKSIVTW